MPKIFMA